jgi:hypothetical protein
MDLNDYWQENKRFVMTVVGGLIAFAIGNAMIGSFIGDELASQKRTRSKVEKDLKISRYLGGDLAMARSENESLLVANSELAEKVGYPTRAEYKLDSSKGTAGNQYFAAVSRVREDILRRAGRVNLRIDQDLGLPSLAPTRDDEIERHLDGLDVVERVLELAISERLDRVDSIEITPDSGLRGSRGVGHVEQTRIKMKMSGRSGPMLRVLASTQTPSLGQPILIEELEIVPERTREDEVRMEVTFVAARLHNTDTEEEF